MCQASRLTCTWKALKSGAAASVEAITAPTSNAATLTVTRTTQMGELTSVYKLDGSESKNTVAGRGGQHRRRHDQGR